MSCRHGLLATAQEQLKQSQTCTKKSKGVKYSPTFEKMVQKKELRDCLSQVPLVSRTIRLRDHSSQEPFVSGTLSKSNKSSQRPSQGLSHLMTIS